MALGVTRARTRNAEALRSIEVWKPSAAVGRLPEVGRRFVAMAHRSRGQLVVAICASLTRSQAASLSRARP